MQANPDTLTTILGLLAATSGLAAQNGIAPQYTGFAAALFVALGGLFTNKKLK